MDVDVIYFFYSFLFVISNFVLNDDENCEVLNNREKLARLRMITLSFIQYTQIESCSWNSVFVCWIQHYIDMYMKKNKKKE